MFNWLAGEMLDTPRQVAVLGLGLIGGSLLRKLGARAIGYDADPHTRDLARSAGRRTADTIADAVPGADLVVLAVPLPAVAEVLGGLAGYRGVLTDVTSVKGPVAALVAEHVPTAAWVGGHPMAGREQSGFAASDETLFDGCAWVLCLDPGTDLANWLRLAALVTRLGAHAVPATSDEHDAAVARISHAPHVVAAALAARAGGALERSLAAGSFRDGTRVAATRPALTAAMCSGNSTALGAELDALITALQGARAIVDDPAALAGWLTPGYTVRSTWPPMPGSVEELPAEAKVLLELGRAGGWITAVADDGATVTAVRPR